MKHPGRSGIGGALFALCFAVVSSTGTVRADTDAFQPETIGAVRSLSGSDSNNWLVVNDAAFFHMLEGRVFLIDPFAPTPAKQVQGMMSASFLASYTRSDTRNEHYVIESFFSRGNRGGERSDWVTIYDADTLDVRAEIAIPPKRVSGMPKTTAVHLLDGEQFLLVYNFTPAQSVSVVDVANRRFVGEIATAGCGFIVASDGLRFASLCSDGAVLVNELDENGASSDAVRIEEFVDAEDDPVFETSVAIGERTYFVTFAGDVQVLRAVRTGFRAERGFSLLTDDDREANWRPGGMSMVSVDDQGAMYVLMHPDGADGTHKNGGSEVWKFEAKRNRWQRTQRIELKTWGLSIANAGSGENRYLAVTNAEMGVDIYDAGGTYAHTLSTVFETPFLLYPMTASALQ